MSQIAKATTKKPESKIESSVSRAQKTDLSQSMNSPVDQILFLQRTIGNQAVARLIKSGALQAKLAIGKPGDIYEQEADRVAEQVLRTAEPQVQRQPEEEEEEELVQPKLVANTEYTIQRQVDEEKEEEEEFLQTKELTGHNAEIIPDLESRIQTIRGGGEPLPESVRAYFEPRFGYDFSQVRVHADARAAESARAVNARAFTVGQDVMFGAGQYAPGTSGGRRLMAHELAHVVQQRAGNVLKPGIAPSIRRQETAARTAPEVVNITIQRDTETAQSTTGTLTIGSHTLHSLELPDRDNAATGVSATASRIPAGTYQAHVRMNADGGNWRLELEGVPGRTNIQIHTGNRPEDITGCILPGTSRGADVVNSSVGARDTIRQEINNAGAGATIQVTISDPPAAPTSP